MRPDPKAAGPPYVVAVVLNWRGLEDSRRCLRSLLATEYPRLGIVVVDNGSGDDSAASLKAEFPAVPVIERLSNDGYAAGNNAGILRALEMGADYILILNNDVTVDPRFVQPMVRCFERHPGAGIVTCKAHFQDNPSRIYTTGGTFSPLRCTVAPLAGDAVDREQEVTFVSGCVMLVKPEVYSSVGLFDERYFMYFEDLEFSLRVARKFSLWYTPEGVIAHKSGGGTSWSTSTPLYLYYMARNRFWVFEGERWPYRIYVMLFSLVLAAVKTALLAFRGLTGADHAGVGKKIAALWKGIHDGVAGSPPAPVGSWVPFPATAVYNARQERA